jgi:hypothetical protein
MKKEFFSKTGNLVVQILYMNNFRWSGPLQNFYFLFELEIQVGPSWHFETQKNIYLVVENHSKEHASHGNNSITHVVSEKNILFFFSPSEITHLEERSFWDIVISLLLTALFTLILSSASLAFHISIFFSEITGSNGSKLFHDIWKTKQNNHAFLIQNCCLSLYVTLRYIYW